ncbi:sigma-70 family RNA polymerase sigma factor [Candidatus Poribacteria bacterium]|nr:sigma-70 family RNA polymerase sigma factor [Candidatus Poribacteria bacterium]MBT5532076.1 sigma-70 family RNA polymerase sigma factor [Candidatus Poribacteria bacterium]MBT5711550.1 sigma-70 family RNA polymerase sigma factor [Candidatus Poribacteria bacterium]MBT7808830.1 sigma-70 family RNA polymerase sigma factor [Candidatus Poribacteria bacterium]
MSDAVTLIERARSPQMPRRAQTEAFAALVRQFQDMAVGYAFSRLGDVQLAEDASQEAFLEAWQNLRQLREPEAFVGWLRRIVLKRCDRVMRVQRPAFVTMEEASATPSREPTPAEHLERSDVRAQVASALNALREHERAVTTLHYITGHTQAEIADFLEVPLGTVKRRLHSARQRMKGDLVGLVSENLREQAPSRDTAFEQRITRLMQPEQMRAPEYQYGVDNVDGNDAWDLMRACAAGDIKEVRRLIRRDANLVNAQHWYQFPIHFAVREGHAEIVRLLLDAGAEPGRSRYIYNSWQDLVADARRRGYDDVLSVLESTLRTRYAYDPEFEHLAQAIRDRDREQIDALLSIRADIARASDLRGANAIHWAGLTHQIDLIDYFLERGANIDAPRVDGQTPAMLTMNGDNRFVRERDLPGDSARDFWLVVEHLLDRGAEYNLSIATMKGDDGRVREILDGDPSAARRLDPCRRSYLHYAAAARRPDIAALFLDLGSGPSMPEDLAPSGRALHTACAQSDLEMVRLLLKHGADVNADVDSSGVPMTISAHRDPVGPSGVAIRELLREQGAVTPPPRMTVDDMRMALESAQTPPHPGSHFADEQFIGHLLRHDDADLIRLLLDARPDALQTVPIVSNRYPKSRECVELMLLHGLDPNGSDWLGKTWLHFIAEKDDVDIARVFLEHGANIDAVEAEHRSTPLAEAAKRGHMDMVRFLLTAGANASIPTEEWARPLAWATQNGHTGIAGLLRLSQRP